MLKTLEQKITLLCQWVVFSSEDSTKFAATVKGTATYALIVAIAPLLHFNSAPQIIDQGITFIVALGQVLSALWAIFGAFRKVNTTLGGQNAVLNDRLLNP